MTTAVPDFAGAAPILVVGDVMLDRYWFGEVNRISPEAPVPVVRIEKAEERLGGAANVARNAAMLGVRTGLLGIVGSDESGQLVGRMVDDLAVDNYLVPDASIATIVKLRVIGRQQQLLRIDFEAPPADVVLRDKLTQFNALLPRYGVIVLSDYAKGGLVNVSEMIGAARQGGKRILVDPKGNDFRRYAGASLLTPNKAELRNIVGQWTSEDDLSAKAQNLRASLELDALLLTRSEEGMTLYQADRIVNFPAMAREVYDVSGAGDTVIATLAAMLGAGVPLEESVAVANRAGGIVVGKLGTATVTREELFPD